ncbi:PREDICTED: homologous-pairing protein 2 homolog [Amphimedon queenslandica]|uniref:Homologous-pairing protein 2 homolog n=1 Tax=Amphimedon queenslandica TaxID=400682 RepID=A0A1X7UHD6_AMPQE|nr:PREDICTED: homologous-pairing protein 2 homolog [Amphimedon queenslandica]|eukprot:XP_011405098.1 PREDICTED: homologous-pairing protein 2 homolog [Amphimedon queenslandica]
MASKAKESEALEKVFKYMKDQNRPYSAGDVFSNMHKEFNKPCVQRVLDQLVSNGKVKEKTYGKQKVYVVDQGLFPVINESEIAKMDDEIRTLQESIAVQESECSAMEAKLSALKNSLTLQEAKEKLEETEKECTKLNERLQVAKAGSENITPEVVEKVHTEHKAAVTHWRKRKRLAMDIVNTILEDFPRSKKELLEEVGLETDEDCGVSIPSTTT